VTLTSRRAGILVYTAVYNPLIPNALHRYQFTEISNEINAFTRTLTPLI
jgi:hypothetical protein